MISDLHSRQFFAKHFTKTQKFGVEGRPPCSRQKGAGGPRSPQAKAGWREAWAGGKNKAVSHLDRRRPGIIEPSDGEEGGEVTPRVPAVSTLTRGEEA